MRLVDRDGLDKLTMRSLAYELEVTPMALYRHVGSKEELLDDVVSQVFAAVPLPAAEMAWDERLRRLAHDARAVAQEHPHLARLLFDRPTRGGAVVGIVDHVYGALLAAGIAPAQVPRYERLITTFVLGFAVSEAGGRFGTDDGVRAVRADRYPELRRALAGPVDWDAEFAANVADLIALIRAGSP